MRLSACCGYPPWNETDLCSECKEHAEFEDENGEVDPNDGEKIETRVYQVKTYVTERSKKNSVLTYGSKLH